MSEKSELKELLNELRVELNEDFQKKFNYVLSMLTEIVATNEVNSKIIANAVASKSSNRKSEIISENKEKLSSEKNSGSIPVPASFPSNTMYWFRDKWLHDKAFRDEHYAMKVNSTDELTVAERLKKETAVTSKTDEFDRLKSEYKIVYGYMKDNQTYSKKLQDMFKDEKKEHDNKKNTYDQPITKE